MVRILFASQRSFAQVLGKPGRQMATNIYALDADSSYVVHGVGGGGHTEELQRVGNRARNINQAQGTSNGIVARNIDGMQVIFNQPSLLY
jgi:hypothetical protein